MLSDGAIRRLLRIPLARQTLLRVAKRLAPHVRELRLEATPPSAEVPAGASAESIDIPEITPLAPRVSERSGEAIRLNLLVPGLSERHVFGGIATALQLFDRLRAGTADLRILVLDELQIAPRRDAYYGGWPVFSLADVADRDPAGPHIVVCGDRYGRTLPVHRSDRFVATIWWSAHLANRLLDWQRTEPGLEAPRLVYLIQDYEPGFYPWSSRYALAEATYRRGDRTIAVINTNLLADYLRLHGVQFASQWVFSPRLNPALADVRVAMSAHRKERLLVAYGRPGTERNAFPLLVAGLRQWVDAEPDAASWEFVSAGEPHAPVALGKGLQLTPVGKLAIGEYAALLGRAAVGMSLMISPHPSYPPLEMAAFGCRVVTNRFANKDLGADCPSITSVERVDAQSLAAALAAATRAATDAGLQPPALVGLDTFLDGADPFAFVPQMRQAWLRQ